MSEIVFHPIGVIHSPFSEPAGTPIQPTAGTGVEGRVELYREYVGGLKDLDGFSHIILLYHCHLTRGYSLLVQPYMDGNKRGMFATRIPSRPNSIGLSIVRLTEIDENVLHIQDLDIVDGTPLLDIKPYVPEFDGREGCRIGWLSDKIQGLPTVRSDGRLR